MIINTKNCLYISLIMVSGLMGTYTLPLLFGFYIDELSFSESLAGNLCMIEILAIAMASILSSFFIASWDKVYVTRVAVALFCLGQVSTAYVDSYYLLFIARVLVGAASGVILAVSNNIIVQMDNPDSCYGRVLAITSLIFSFLLWFFPVVYLEFGALSIFVSISIVAIMAGLVVKNFSQLYSGLLVSSLSAKPGKLDIKLIVLFFVAMTAIYIVTGGTWTFVERLGKNNDISLDEVGVLLAISTLFGILGAATAGLLANRFGRTWPSFSGFVVSGFSCYLLIAADSYMLYVLAIVLYGYSYMFTLSYVLSIAAALDKQGRVAVAANGYLLIPYSLGVVLYAQLGGESLPLIGSVAMLACFVSSLLIVYVSWQASRDNAGYVELVGHGS
ncbi:hypothetical protein NO559_06150 [Dasania sp. GY-MA-18]|uniref:MFS transporter n=1 Tax=Dasania phycosphaerae TaxID=2950436 RepID=A0A9J6RL93_9GAMM|nr:MULTISPECIES: MFS transporter [Dasania]MCR8922345.1 hypothetical protein [Dasania sp. GY-MA-18]MCZ0864773.1 hypothetical protein [Dasania phycosphaerae]MCZ0868501.1 hypothetical protein [Dasania phycosphaerae]